MTEKLLIELEAKPKKIYTNETIFTGKMDKKKILTMQKLF